MDIFEERKDLWAIQVEAIFQRFQAEFSALCES
jgi:hypothetical protein